MKIRVIEGGFSRVNIKFWKLFKLLKPLSKSKLFHNLLLTQIELELALMLLISQNLPPNVITGAEHEKMRDSQPSQRPWKTQLIAGICNGTVWSNKFSMDCRHINLSIRNIKSQELCLPIFSLKCTSSLPLTCGVPYLLSLSPQWQT